MKLLWQKFHWLGNKLHLPDIPNWLCAILALVVILRIPTFFEPYYYGDEMVYLTLGQGVRQGLTLYKDIYDNKPPLLYLTAAAAGSLFWFKVILAFWSLAVILFFFKLCQKVFDRVGTQKLATFIFALLTTLPILEGPTVNSELFMIGFTILAFLILLKDSLSSQKLLLAGALLGLGTLFKVPAAFDAPVIVFYWLITKGFTHWKEILRDSLILFVGFLVPILLTLAYYFFAGALNDYIKAAFLQNIGYLSSFRPQDIQKSFLARNAPLLIRAGIVLIGSVIIYIFRNRLSKKFILFSVWTLFALFAVTLSERPYPHYFLQAVTPISFLLAMLFAEKSFEQSLTVIPLALAFFVPVYYKFYLYPVTPYYIRFINFAAGRISRDQYFNSFDANTVRNYKIADFLVKSTNPKDRVFIWDPASPTIYALSRRLPPEKYVVPYHVHDFSSTKEVASLVAKNPPKLIVLTARNPYPELSPLIAKRYLLIQQIEGANIYVRREVNLF